MTTIKKTGASSFSVAKCKVNDLLQSFLMSHAHSEHRFPALSSKLCTLRASLSGTFLQTLHTPSIAFRHFPPNSARTAHSEHRFPALSSRLCRTAHSEHCFPALALRHSARTAHSHHRFPALSSKLHNPSIAFRHFPPNSLELLTPSVAFRHFPPDSARTAHSERRFPPNSLELHTPSVAFLQTV